MTEPLGGIRRRIEPPRGFGLRRAMLGLVALALLALVVVPWLATTITDWLWFRSVHFESVYSTGLTARLVLFVLAGLAAFAFLYSNFWWAWRRFAGVPALYISREGHAVDFSLVVPRLMLGATIVIAFITGLAASAQWLGILMALHGARVGEADPLFGRDIGFYLFRLPAIDGILGALNVLTVITIAGVLLLYAVRGAVNFKRRAGIMQPSAAWHVGALLAFLFLLFAVELWVVDTSALLYSHTGPFTGASYTDVHVRLPGIRISAIAAVLAAGFVIYGIIRERLVASAVLAFAGYAGVSIIARAVAPAAEQNFAVAPNELTREREYLQRHIAATRRAWRLDSVTTRSLEGDLPLTIDDVRNDAPTIDNVRLWERDLLMQTLKQLQEIRTYYDFVSVNDDRYTIDGDYRQVHLSVRELNAASLPTQTFINNRLTFTHGMGVTMAPVNQVTDEGLPVLFIKDLPPVSTVGIKLTRPEIYYGQAAESYVFVNTKQKEFDYPLGDKNIYTSYPGTGGVPVGSFLRRALYAWQFGSLQVLFSDDINGGARIMYRRNIMERASTVLPFLSFDAEPYIVITDDGRLEWVLDGYTTSSGYPYSKPAGGIDYMRNSVKVTIDAYNGAVTAYVVDAADPVIRTYEQIFAGIFKPMSAMPADIRRHMRYPGQLFRTQALLQATYHMDDPQAFYHREDEWQIPETQDRGNDITAYMRHMIMRLPGEQKEEFIYMTPFTPRGKDNLAAWMVARMDGAHYGELRVYRFPKQSLVYGPKQIVNRINQDTDISRQITLWDQRGSEVIHGELLVIPINESLIYVQPLFLRASGGSIPEMKRVVVASGDRVVMAETLDQALTAMFGGGAALGVSGQQADTAAAGAPLPAAAVPAASAAVGSLVQQAQSHYDRAIAAQRAGDWATYGKEISALGSVLEQLRARHP